ncbi:MAG: hypothetical protein ETSY1_40305 [Candidatus Entotheonella factor]|uniref:Right handed beta helix domain-containing protein n=1 Tax=Entotheonella factor TaxID=1429438 RepID=W4L554_ENTF1|nr:right-handed parallel beta-helix repeat-containing protein [Candidatus Entotheonella palauensis]ETW93187.1 MAG: hypothetical protein ETSY1_40305 [Candidatus Entotheonella factor]
MTQSRLIRTLMALGLFASLNVLGLSNPNPAAAQVTIPVDCNDPTQTLNGALQAALPGDTIQVTGTCQEMVTITTDNLTIDGQGSTIIDGGGGFPIQPTLVGVITIEGASNVHLTGLTVQNGPDGILMVRGASARLTDVTSRDNADEGLQVIDGATATFGGTIVSQDNGDDGIGVFHTSSLTINSGSSVSSLNNGDDGISVFSSSSVRAISTAIRLDNNGQLDQSGDGLQVSGTSTIFFSGTTTINANQNALRGIVLSSASYLLFLDTSAAILTNNGNDGLGIFNVSRFVLGSGTALRSESNGDTGIVVSSIAIASCSSESTVSLLNNAVAPSFVSLNSQVSSACLEPMTTNQVKGQRSTEPQVEEAETH